MREAMLSTVGTIASRKQMIVKQCIYGLARYQRLMTMLKRLGELNFWHATP